MSLLNQGSAPATRVKAAPQRKIEAELRTELHTMGLEKVKLADLLDDVDIARIIRARQDGVAIKVFVEDV